VTAAFAQLPQPAPRRPRSDPHVGRARQRWRNRGHDIVTAAW